MFILTSILLGIALAMDAFSVSIVNGLNEPNMRTRKKIIIPLVFAIFQFIMPLIGFICVKALAEKFKTFADIIFNFRTTLLVQSDQAEVLPGFPAQT